MSEWITQSIPMEVSCLRAARDSGDHYPLFYEGQQIALATSERSAWAHAHAGIEACILYATGQITAKAFEKATGRPPGVGRPAEGATPTRTMRADTPTHHLTIVNTGERPLRPGLLQVDLHQPLASQLPTGYTVAGLEKHQARASLLAVDGKTQAWLALEELR